MKKLITVAVLAAALSNATPAMYGPGVKAEAWNQHVRKVAPEPWSCDFDDLWLWIKGIVWR